MLTITEPNQPKKNTSTIGLGIDLGTTNSLIARIKNNAVSFYTDANGNNLLRSTIAITPDKQVTIGNIELTAQNISSVKRLLGINGKEALEKYPHLQALIVNNSDNNDNNLYLNTHIGKQTPIELSAKILEDLLQRVEPEIKNNIAGAVITVPAYFDYNKRKATSQAAQIAGIKVLRLLNEPTAAALAYGLDDEKLEGKLILVYDLGGGTFDVSILQLHTKLFKTLGVGGDNSLGGDDIDEAIKKFLIAKFKLNIDSDKQFEILQIAKSSKHKLADNKNIDFQWQGQSYKIAANEIINQIQPIVAKTIAICKQTLNNIDLNNSDIAKVILVGGSTKLPLIKAMLEQEFHGKVFCNKNPDTVVAEGAAIKANSLAGNNNDITLVDVTPLALGLEIMGGLVDQIIPRNSPIPTIFEKNFTTQKHGQTKMRFSIVQGERELAADCRQLATFTLKGIPPMRAGSARVSVIFQIDADGILNIMAKETTTEVTAQIEINPAYGLSPNSIQKMIHSSIDNGKTDIKQRILIEQKQKAQQLIEYIEQTMAKYAKELLTVEKLQQLTAKVTKFKQLVNTANVDSATTIKQQTAELNQDFTPFAEQIMVHTLKNTSKDI